MRTALFIGTVWPEPTSSAAGVRDLFLLRALRDTGWRVVCASSGRDTPFRAALESEGFATRAVQANDPAFDSWMAELKPDLALFDRFLIEEQFGWRVREAAPGCLRVVDTVDLHFLRRGRQAEILDGEPFDWHSPTALRELASLLRSDLALVVSDFERDVLIDRYGMPADQVALVRWGYSDAELGLAPGGGPAPVSAAPPFAAREGFALIGNFRHAPNLDGVLWFHRELWPRLRALAPAGTTAHVYGAYPPREAMLLDDPAAGFRVHGQAPDARETLARHRVSLAPLRFGAGIKGKVLDAWRAGAPVVGTAVAAEGMTGGLPFGGAVADSPERFAEEAARLLTREGDWADAVEKGRRVLAAHYRAEPVSRAWLDSLEGALSRRDERRAGRFVSAMLWHHTLASTRHLSRYIELKNAAGPGSAHSAPAIG